VRADERAASAAVTLRPMRSCRSAIERCEVGAERLDLGWAQLFLVIRDGDTGPGPNDWEANLTTPDGAHVPPGSHVLRLELADGTVVSGRALLRFSDGQRHLFRGDGTLAGADLVVGPALA
jgi:hypothetical protein